MELDPDTVYPENADLLILPSQGKENMAEAAMEIVERLKPARIGNVARLLHGSVKCGR